MTKEDILSIVKSVLQDSVKVSDINDSGYVDFYIDSEYVASPNWCQKAYERKYDLIDGIMAEIEKEIEKEEKPNEEPSGNTRVMKGSDLISLMNTFSQSTHVWNSIKGKIKPDKMYEVEYTIGYGWEYNDEEYNILREIN